jgi:hypothetical protein
MATNIMQTALTNWFTKHSNITKASNWGKGSTIH